MMRFRNRFAILGLAAALVAVAGCFNEPRPAYDSVPAETRVYLKDQGLETLTVDAVRKFGRVFIDERAGEKRADDLPNDAPAGHYEELSERLGDKTFDPASLDYLNLDYNKLTNVEAVVAFTGLKWLRLNENRLTTLPDLSPLKNLRRLYLRGNDLSDDEIAKAIPADALPDLDTVVLSGNLRVTVVPQGLAKRTGLAHLDLSGTGITELPEDLSAWRSLKTLQLGNLRMKSFEEMQRIRQALPKTTVVF